MKMRPDDAVAYNPRAKLDFTVSRATTTTIECERCALQYAFFLLLLLLQIRVRIIEAKELQGGESLQPLVRVHLGGKTRTTRAIRGTDSPRWDQTLSFTLRTSIEALAMLNCEFYVSAMLSGSFRLHSLQQQKKFSSGLFGSSPHSRFAHRHIQHKYGRRL